MRAAVVVSSDHHVLARVWAGPLVLNAADWPAGCELLGPFAATVPGRDNYTAGAGTGRAVEVSWPTLAAAGKELDVAVPFDRAGAASVPGARTVPSPSPAPPIP